MKHLDGDEEGLDSESEVHGGGGGEEPEKKRMRVN